MSDRELVARVRELAIVESTATADLVAHLAELDERRLYLEEGYPSLFAYCVEALHLSEHAVYNRIEAARIEAARTARRFPLVLERLREGAIHLTAVRLLKPHLTGENHRALLDAAHHKSRREVEELIARLSPRPDVPATVRKLPVKPALQEAAVATESLLCSNLSGDLPAVPNPPAPATPDRPVASSSPGVSRPVVTPLAPERYRIQFTASASAHTLLRRAQELLRHQIPDGDPAEILEMALATLVKELEWRKFAVTERPVRNASVPVTSRACAEGTDDSRASRVSRHIPASVRREVRARDQDRCAFATSDGRRCPARGGLEFHHQEPYARGGPATVTNISLRCRAHNRFEAELHFRPRERRQTDLARGRGEIGGLNSFQNELAPG